MDMSILIPTYYEEGNISKLINNVKKTASQITKNFEIIVMDGGSKDETVLHANKAGAKVFLRSSFKFSTFLKEGLPRCSGKYIITLDADGSHPPTYIKNLWEKRKKADIIIASKWVDGSKVEMPRSRFLISKTLNFLSRILSGIKTNDVNSNYRLYNKKIFRAITFKSDGSEILLEILIEAKKHGFKIIEIPFIFKKRHSDKSKFNLRLIFLYLNLLLRNIFTLKQ